MIDVGVKINQISNLLIILVDIVKQWFWNFELENDIAPRSVPSSYRHGQEHFLGQLLCVNFS